MPYRLSETTLTGPLLKQINFEERMLSEVDFTERVVKKSQPFVDNFVTTHQPYHITYHKLKLRQGINFNPKSSIVENHILKKSQ